MRYQNIRTMLNSCRTSLKPLAAGAKLAILFLLMAPVANADSISDATYLRKISFHLRGYQPLPSEYVALNASVDHQEFLNSKIKQYLLSNEHAERMVFRLTNAFAMKSPSTRDTQLEASKDSSGSYQVQEVSQDAASDLFRRMGRDNLSWDKLLTSKDYNLFKPTNFQYGSFYAGSDFNFLQSILPQLAPYVDDGTAANFNQSIISPMAGQHVPVSFETNDPRIAGVLTTNRFIHRYRNTALNKNRRRAAAVFRIFLCDSMSQGFVQTSDKKEDHVNSVFETDGTLTEDQLRESLKGSSAESQHGKNQSCVGCHYKLDPMGRTFQTMTDVIDDRPSPGALAYERGNGQLVHVAVAGIGELGQAITQQPEYVNCQVDWFWKEFIGIDVPLSEERRAQLVHSFNAVGRRTNDFIAVLLKSYEFRERPKSSQFVEFARVQPLLKRCDSCHDSDGTTSAPPFAVMPYMDGNIDATDSWLKAISRRLNLPADHKDHMPKHSEEWSNADIQLLKAWVSGGAHDVHGLVHLLPSPLAEPTSSMQLGVGK